MEKDKNEQITTDMEQSKEQTLSMDAGTVEAKGRANAFSAQKTRRSSPPRKGVEVDPNVIINSFRSNDASIPLAARVTENNETKDEAPTKEDVDKAISDSKAEESRLIKKPKPMPVKAKDRISLEEYISTYYKDAGVSPKTGKTAYLCNEHHKRIQKLIRAVGNGETTLFSYLYNIVEQHFIQLREVIEEAYETNNSIY